MARNSVQGIRNTASGALLAGTLSALVTPSPVVAQEDKAVQLPALSVTGDALRNRNPNANPDAPYKIERSANDKFTEPLRDTPRTITAIPKEVIEDMGATSFREVVRATPGVTLGTGEGGNAFGDRIFIRGFEARNDVYIDGLRDPGVSSREIFAVEQIEIVKGPSGSFGGRGTTGGLVSLQSKRAVSGDAFAVLEGGLGTEKYRRVTVDANAPVGERVALRVNGLYHDADTPGRDHVEQERKGIAAAATVQATDALLIGGDYYFYRLNGIPDYGHPFDATTQQPYKVNRDNLYGVIGRDFLRNTADIGTIRIEYDPQDRFSVRSVTRYGGTKNHYIVGTPSAVCRRQRTDAGACPTTGPELPESGYTVTAGGQRRWANTSYVASLLDGTVRFDTGALKHTLVVGGEFARERVKSYPLLVPAFVEDSAGNVLSTSTFVRNLLTPNPILGYSIPVAPDRSVGPTRVQVISRSAYLIDTVKLGQQWQMVLGGRFDRYDVDFLNPDSSTAAGLQPLALENEADLLNGQASLVYKPSVPATLYASASTSSNPSGEQIDGNGIAYDGLAPQTANLKPERNLSLEAGAKYELAEGKLLLSGALFQITKRNARENTGNNVYELVGKLRSRGVELGVNGSLTEKLQLFGGYTYTSAKIVESATAANVGRRFANIPRHSASLLATYLLTPQFQVGGQIYWQDAMYGGTLAAGTAKVPGYARLDAVARWRPTDLLELRLNVLNLTDKTYYDAIYRSASPFAYVAPGRSATLSLTVKL